MDERDENAIRLRAYQLWLDAGQPNGEHDAHWQQAESEGYLRHDANLADGIPREDRPEWSQTINSPRAM